MLSVEVLTVGLLRVNCYIVYEGHDCVIIDPGSEAERVLSALWGRRVLAVVATHLHFDHVSAAYEVFKATGAPFVVHRLDWELRGELAKLAQSWGFEAPELPSPTFVDEGSQLPLGLRVMHTPGHTLGSITVVGRGLAFTGDTLFARGVGRADLPGGDWSLLVESVCRLYRELPDSCKVYPGHGPPTVISEERKGNPLVPWTACTDSA